MEGLNGGEKVVTSAHFLIDSESRLREAISKMLDVESEDHPPQSTFGNGGGNNMSLEDDDMDMSDMTLE